jgi:hypothetical protein
MSIKLIKTNKNIKWILLSGLIIYSISFIATSRPFKEDPCSLSINSFFDRDTTLKNYVYFQNIYNDTIKLDADTLNPNIINWNKVTDSVCYILTNSCGKNNKYIVVINSKDTLRNQWDTRYGKKIFAKQCP